MPGPVQKKFQKRTGQEPVMGGKMACQQHPGSHHQRQATGRKCKGDNRRARKLPENQGQGHEGHRSRPECHVEIGPGPVCAGSDLVTLPGRSHMGRSRKKRSEGRTGNALARERELAGDFENTGRREPHDGGNDHPVQGREKNGQAAENLHLAPEDKEMAEMRFVHPPGMHAQPG